MSINADGNLGFWDEINPSYTIFNKEKEMFSSIWTMYSTSFIQFYENCISDTARYSNAVNLTPKPNEPLNTFNISCLPWVSFTGFNLNVFTDGCYLPPIFTIGKFIEQDKKVLMPLSVQVHHSVCDGYHVGRFVNALQDFADSYNDGAQYAKTIIVQNQGAPHRDRLPHCSDCFDHIQYAPGSARCDFALF
ncbi:CatA-like O-acetyltransferase [Clostridium boliviensis]|uniref:Chloramphenicol acetyltransferase n=1 Tax=Clostridium boliviensis TaxID=318465 RepID=A0ABU4GJ98_9CLOT|nr:CatA-like O-acetyltransferase [Clostridium boliviensis]MDW2797671.1 CatA-like O-acetyltransferase [Clostridium boliviensis]